MAATVEARQAPTAKDVQQASHVVFMNLAATGHVNPTLPIVAELRRRGCLVTYFIEDKLQSVVESAGAQWRPFRHPGSSFTGLAHCLDEEGVRTLVPEGVPEEHYMNLPSAAVWTALRVLPGLLEDLRQLQPAPSIIVYEPFLAFPLVAAKVLGLPAIGMLTMMGPGVIGAPPKAIEQIEQAPWVQMPRRQILETYGVDVLKQGAPMEFYSPLDNLVATVDSLYAPPTSERQLDRFGSFHFTCVGPIIDAAVKRISHVNLHQASSLQQDIGATPASLRSSLSFSSGTLPLRQLEKARSEGRRVLFISLGTVATGEAYWRKPFGVVAAQNGACAEGGRPLVELTGKEFCQWAWRRFFEAFGGNESVFVVMTLGPQQDALEDMPHTPANFVLRDAVPQLEMLERCDAMVTHGGCNSMHEALRVGIPLAVVPIFGDQPTNGETVARFGAGVSFSHPLKTLSAAALREDVGRLLDADTTNPFRAAAAVMAEKLRSGGGAPAAASAILSRAQSDGMHHWGGC